MAKIEYQTQGTCSSKIIVELEGKIIKHVEFIGGCNGNLKGISKLVEGMDYEDVVARLKGNTCGKRNTSCPDQLTKALEQAAKLSD